MIVDAQALEVAVSTNVQEVHYQFVQDDELLHVGGGTGTMHF